MCLCRVAVGRVASRRLGPRRRAAYALRCSAREQVENITQLHDMRVKSGLSYHSSSETGLYIDNSNTVDNTWTCFKGRVPGSPVASAPRAPTPPAGAATTAHVRHRLGHVIARAAMLRPSRRKNAAGKRAPRSAPRMRASGPWRWCWRRWTRSHRAASWGKASPWLATSQGEGNPR